MTDLATRVIAVVRKEIADHHLFAEVPEITAETVLEPRWFGPVDRCCVAIELDEVFGIECSDANLEAWQTVADIIATVARLAGEPVS
jgi:hypothetical protein